MSNPLDRVAARAAEIRPARMVAATAAAPIYLVGLAVGFLFVVAIWIAAAAAEGFATARTIADPKRPPAPGDA